MRLKTKFNDLFQNTCESLGVNAYSEPSEESIDVQKIILNNVVLKIKSDTKIMSSLKSGMCWGVFMNPIKDALPDTDMDKGDTAYQMVPQVMSALFGTEGWETYKDEKGKTCIRSKQ